MSETLSEPTMPTRPGGRPFAVLVAAGILLSRIAGLVRERVFAHYLGSSIAADAFKAALKIPNFLQNLFGEGVLSASFIPVYARLVAQRDQEFAGRVAGVFASILAFGVSLFVLLGVLATPYLIGAIAPGFEGPVRGLTIDIVRILFPGVGLLVLSAWCLGVLNSHHKFFLSYVAPVLWNIAIIATLVAFGSRMRQGDLVRAVAWGTVAGSLLQLAVQLPFVIRYARPISFGFDLRLKPVREVFRNLMPVVLGRGVVQFSAYVDQVIASYLPAGAVSTLAYAQTIYLLPISLFGASVAAAELPQMSRQTGVPNVIYAVVRDRLETAQRQVAFFVIPSVVAILLIGRHLVAAVYQTGSFGQEQTLYVWYVLMGSSVGLLAATLGRLYSSAFYALRDTRTPLKFAVVRVILTGALGYVFAFPLRWVVVEAFSLTHLRLPDLPGGGGMVGTVALTASAGVAGWIEFLLLRRALHQRIGRIVLPVRFQLSLWLSAASAGCAALALDVIASRLWLYFQLGPATQGAVIAVMFGTAFTAGALLLRIPEAFVALRRITTFRRRP
ncbi:MAG TPA: murein biosynthesis integral membrane protein MurJ [Thermoanaerobaculia bacterium]|nr:murein biosynthesis integral membrane protein MurJ [Thermoanaerobaculia bacterium]